MFQITVKDNEGFLEIPVTTSGIISNECLLFVRGRLLEQYVSGVVVSGRARFSKNDILKVPGRHIAFLYSFVPPSGMSFINVFDLEVVRTDYM